MREFFDCGWQLETINNKLDICPEGINYNMELESEIVAVDAYPEMTWWSQALLLN